MGCVFRKQKKSPQSEFVGGFFFTLTPLVPKRNRTEDEDKHESRAGLIVQIHVAT